MVQLSKLSAGARRVAPPPLRGPRRHPDRPDDGRARRHHRQRRPAPHPAQPGLLELVAVLGPQRLRPHLRRPAAARGPLGRPARPAADLPGRDRPVLPELPGRRVRHHQLDAAGRPGPAGSGRRPGRTGRPGPAHHHLPRGAGAGAGHRPVHHRLRRRRGHRPGRRRPAHRVGVVALGHVRQRPHRPGRARSSAAPCWSRPSAATAGSTWPAP